MNISYLKNKNIHFVECENWHDAYGYEKSEMKEDTIKYIEQLQQENKKYKEVNDKAINLIVKETESMPMNGCKIRLIELLHILKEVE